MKKIEFDENTWAEIAENGNVKFVQHAAGFHRKETTLTQSDLAQLYAALFDQAAAARQPVEPTLIALDQVPTLSGLRTWTGYPGGGR